MRVIGLDVSHTVIEVAYLEDGRIRSGGRVSVSRAAQERFAKSLSATDHVVLEATGNTAAIVNALKAHVGRVVVANPLQVRLIAEAKVKTDKIDASILAQLYASGFLPEVWIPDESTQALRRQVARRTRIIRQRVRLKNEIHSVLATHLIAKSPAADLFGKKGRAWLAAQPLPLDERLGVEQRLRELDRLGEDQVAIDRLLGEAVLRDERMQRLLTITGVNAAVAIGILAAIGDIDRFASPEKLVSYFGLNPKVHQSGEQPAKHGHISKCGRAHARAMLVEAAWAIAKAPGPLRAFFFRIRAPPRRASGGGGDSSQARGDRLARASSKRGLRVDSTSSHGDEAASARAAGWFTQPKGVEPGMAADYSLQHVRERERAMAEQAERSYARFVANWRGRPKAKSTGAAIPTRLR